MIWAALRSSRGHPLPISGSMIGRHSDSEYRRLRAYESLLVLAVAIFMTVIVGGATVVAVLRPLHAVARSLSPTP